MPRQFHLILWASAALLAIGVLAMFWARGRARPAPPAPAPAQVKAGLPAPDPRETFATVYRNVRPNVRYAGDAACTACHRELCDAYHKHPMGRSLASVAQATAIEPRSPEPLHHNPFVAGRFEYSVDLANNKVVHSETQRGSEGQALIETAREMQYAVGSGRQGRSYLFVQDGCLFMSPITWYPRSQRWDLSPGYETNNSHFSRAVQSNCLFCHANSAQQTAGSLNHFQPMVPAEAIGCERCHGPGELHVAKYAAVEKDTSARGPPAKDALDDTIVNPADLPPALAEAVCQQCHLAGMVRVVRRGREMFDFRPGLPLESFLSVFVRRADPAPGSDAAVDTRFVSHVEQMHASRCFQESAGKLGCTSCHDPHRLPEDRATWYAERCNACHADRGCSLPVAKRREQAGDAEACIQCHMPALATEVNHTALSDHRIVRHAPQDADDLAANAAPPQRKPPQRPAGDALPLVPFHATRAIDPAADPELARDELARDLGIAILVASDTQRPLIDVRDIDAAIPLLEAAVARDPADDPASEALGHAYWRQGRRQAAVEVFRRVLARSPEREFALDSLASRLMALQDYAAAAELWERAIQKNPTSLKYHLEHALCCAHLRRWPACKASCERALALQPSNPGARQLWVESWLGLGDLARAEQEFALLLELDPESRPQRERWWNTHPLRVDAATKGERSSDQPAKDR